mmetsp:Transcript_5778/g.17046  ORF Transcript_5778/g.17046 Transcript_5778/m.17046 type:complete len:224 (+) Transcript_5778:604-1275(+)
MPRSSTTLTSPTWRMTVRTSGCLLLLPTFWQRSSCNLLLRNGHDSSFCGNNTSGSSLSSWRTVPCKPCVRSWSSLYLGSRRGKRASRPYATSSRSCSPRRACTRACCKLTRGRSIATRPPCCAEWAGPLSSTCGTPWAGRIRMCSRMRPRRRERPPRLRSGTACCRRPRKCPRRCPRSPPRGSARACARASSSLRTEWRAGRSRRRRCLRTWPSAATAPRRPL